MSVKGAIMTLSNEHLERYSRHIVMPEIGIEGQIKLLESKVLVIGAGAIGGSALMYLAGAGIGTIGIADDDVVSVSNLQRQVIHSFSDVGKSKLESAKETLLGINPDVNIIMHKLYVNSDNIHNIIKDYDFVLDCTDNFETKFLINDACVRGRKAYVHAGVLKFGGQIMTYVPDKGPCLRCLFEDVPDKKDVQSCAEAGIIGAITGVVGSLEAMEAIKYILGIGELLTGRILNINGLSMNTTIMRVPERNPNCRICG